MYDYEVQRIITALARGETISETENEVLSAVLHEFEREMLVTLCQELLVAKDVDEMIGCADFWPEDFCRRFEIPTETWNRWMMEGPTPFEKEMILFLICESELQDERMHFCRECGRMFFEYEPNGGFCPDCREGLLLRYGHIFR